MNFKISKRLLERTLWAAICLLIVVSILLDQANPTDKDSLKISQTKSKEGQP